MTRSSLEFSEKQARVSISLAYRHILSTDKLFCWFFTGISILGDLVILTVL